MKRILLTILFAVFLRSAFASVMIGLINNTSNNVYISSCTLNWSIPSQSYSSMATYSGWLFANGGGGGGMVGFGFTGPDIFNYTCNWTFADGSSGSASGSGTCNSGSPTMIDASQNHLTQTNFVMNLVNNLNTAQKAVWTFNGAVVKTEILQPGQSDSYTTPNVNVLNGVISNFSMNGTLSDVSASVGVSGVDSSGNPIISFGSGTGSSSSGTVGSSGGSVTSTSQNNGTYTGTILGTNNDTTLNLNSSAPRPAPTNIISFLPSTGNPAQEPTMQAGIQQAHLDAANNLNGLSALDQDLKNIFNQTMVVTNQLGVISLYSRSNNDVGWQLVRSLTNLTVSGSSGGSNTFNQSSNVWVMNQPTNYLQSLLDAVTNDYGLDTNDFFSTNLLAASWSTNFAISTNDPMAGFQWNVDLPTNYDQAEVLTREPTIMSVGSMIATIQSQITDFSASMDDYAAPVVMTWDFGTVGLPGGLMDFDPLHNGAIAAIFALARQMFSWAIALMFFSKILDDAFKCVMIMNNAHGVSVQAFRATLSKVGGSLPK